VEQKVHFHVDPLLLGAFPGSAVQASDLLKSQTGRAPVWFDISLLDMLRLLRSNNPRVAIDSFAHTMFQLQNLRRHLSFKSEDSTRQQLGKHWMSMRMSSSWWTGNYTRSPREIPDGLLPVLL
jgi:hypothetical protein